MQRDTYCHALRKNKSHSIFFSDGYDFVIIFVKLKLYTVVVLFAKMSRRARISTARFFFNRQVTIKRIVGKK